MSKLNPVTAMMILLSALSGQRAHAGSCGVNPFGEHSGYEVPWPTSPDCGRKNGRANREKEPLAQIAEHEEKARALCRKYFKLPADARRGETFQQCVVSAGGRGESPKNRRGIFADQVPLPPAIGR